MFVRRIIENNEEARIRLSKTYQSFVAIVGGHYEINVRNYITRKVQNVSEEDDAKEFGKIKNFFKLNLEVDHSIKNTFWVDARSRAVYEYFRDVVSFDTTYNTNSIRFIHSIDTSWMCFDEKLRIFNYSNGYLNIGFVAWEERHQKRFLPINVH
ncbi:hypothetical protein Ahy_B08g090697 [Arachis hypogaea]|uniref:Protein FAR1-RELATED SEQUENCE n=1 Tax=Arachis hypogaea TaxID=3818 RepID=A0A444Y0H6_ARAHY|nr:hypothetical protein Ahy_B08g090697 [Arachis hypogaea]